MAGYGSWLPKQAPPPLAGKNGEAFFQRLGEMFDEQTDRFRQGALARFPVKGSVDANGIYGTPPSDALDAIGSDRGMPRATAEVIVGGDSTGVIAAKDLAYSTRLQAAWTTWDMAGSHYGVLRALELAGFVSPHGIIVQDNGRWSKITGSAGNIADWTFGALSTCFDQGGAVGWTFDPRTTFFSQFGIVYTSMPSALSTPSGQSVHNSIINQWRPGKANFVGTFVITSGRILGFAASPTTLPLIGTGTVGGARTFIEPNV